MYENIKAVCFAGSRCDGRQLLDLASEAAGDEDCWELFAELVCRFVREALPGAQQPRDLYAAYEAALKVLDETTRLNMDKKLAALQVLSGIGSAC